MGELALDADDRDQEAHDGRAQHEWRELATMKHVDSDMAVLSQRCRQSYPHIGVRVDGGVCKFTVYTAGHQ